MPTHKSRKALARERSARKALLNLSRAATVAKKKLSLVGVGNVINPRKIEPTPPPPATWHELPMCDLMFKDPVTNRIPKEVKLRGKDFAEPVKFMEECTRYMTKTFNKAYPKKR
jgi:hypothetical protein